MLSFSSQRERLATPDDLRGWFWGGYASHTNVSSNADGTITGLGVNAGVYGAKAFENGLFIDYYGAGAVGHHRFELGFDKAYRTLQAEGQYTYGAVFAGAALSGQVDYDGFTIRPRAGVDLAYAVADDPKFDVSLDDITQAGSLGLEPVLGARIAVDLPFIFERPFGDSAEQTRTVQTRVFEIAPRLFCENGFDSTSSTTCGYGGSLSMNIAAPQKGTTFAFMLDHEQGDRSRRTRVELRREQTLLNGAGSFLTAATVDQAGAAELGASLELEF